MRSLFPIELLQLRGKPAPACYELTEHTVSFNGICEECRPYCGTLCCTSYKFVALTEEEARSGLYEFKEASDGCDCLSCQEMRQAGIKYSLLKKSDYSCVYLSKEKLCGIYENRPQTCRNYTCRGQVFPLRPEL